MTDTRRCKQEVSDYSSRWPSYHQCSFKAKKDGYCTMHHPDSVKAREEKQRLRYEAERAKSPYVLLNKANDRIVELERELAEAEKERDACAQMNDEQARRVFAAEAELAEKTRLAVEAREEGRITGLREAAEMVEMTDLSKVADPSWKLFFADMFIQIAANIRAAEGKK